MSEEDKIKQKIDPEGVAKELNSMKKVIKDIASEDITD